MTYSQQVFDTSAAVAVAFTIAESLWTRHKAKQAKTEQISTVWRDAIQEKAWAQYFDGWTDAPSINQVDEGWYAGRVRF